MKVKVIESFRDKEFGVDREVGSIFECKDKRGKELVEYGLVVLEEGTPDPEADSLKSKEQELSEKETILNDKEKELVERENTLKNKEAELNELQEIISSKQKDLELKEEKLKKGKGK